MQELGVVVAGAGVGRRFGGETYKQFKELNGKPVFLWSIETFLSMPMVKEVAAVVPEGYEERFRKLLDPLQGSKRVTVVSGGPTRQKSVENGLHSLSSTIQWVAVHDAARPLVTEEIIEKTFLLAVEIGAAVPGVPIPDTVKEIGGNGLILRTLERSRLVLAQTPQICRKRDLENAMEWAKGKGIDTTDEASLLEAFGITVGTVEGSRFNLKITTKEDLVLAKGIIDSRKVVE